MFDKVMIVAHPDDELLWGWKDLVDEDGWLVILISEPVHNTQKRISDFEQVMTALNCEKKILGYLDDPSALAWDYQMQKLIQNDISDTISNVNIKKIVTHNPDGEYGHYHHKVVSKIVANSVVDQNTLYYFSFDSSCLTEFSEVYNKCFNLYFKDSLHDETVIGHRNLSKICKITPMREYTNMGDLIRSFYPSWFMGCSTNTFKEYIN